jgi:cell division inhibitor SulA
MALSNTITAHKAGEESQGIREVLRNPDVWRLGQLPIEKRQSISSGYPSLDLELPESGWPVGALTELLTSQRGIGELSLLAPALRWMSQEKRGIALLAPPQLPNPRCWEATGISLDRMLIVEVRGTELLWAAEQVLRSGECGVVLLWTQSISPSYKALQRLHMAAIKGNSACILYRPVDAQASPSPAPLRLALKSKADALEISILKRRGSIGGTPFQVKPFPTQWSTQALNSTAAAPITELLSLER